jgi:hypothetical protein
VNAERTDDGQADSSGDPRGAESTKDSRTVRSEQPDDAGASRVTPGQRASRRGSGTRRAEADLPSTPTELPPVPALAPPTTALPTTVAPGRSSTKGTPAPAEVTGTDAPTSEFRGPALRAPDARVAPVPTNVYRARRPGVAILLVLPAVGVGVLLVRALAIAAFGDTFDLAGILASVFALASLPFLVAGVYGLVTGAAYGAEHYGFKVWARPPLAYLIVGLAFVAAAGFAIG